MGGGGGAAFDATSITGAPAAASLALADLFPVAQSGVLAKATIQQALDAGGLLAADSSPADTDKFLVNQGGAAKTLLLSVARTQLDRGTAGGRTINGGTASTDTLTLADNALPVAKFTGVAAATDYLQVTSSATGGGANGPTLLATGSDATVDMLFDVKGVGGRYVFNVGGATKADLNSGAGSGAALRVAGDFVTQIGGGRFGAGTENIRFNNGGTWVDIEVNNVAILRLASGQVGFLGQATAPASAQAGGAQLATPIYTATERAMLQAAYDCLRTFGFLT